VLALLGIAIGIPSALAATRLLASMLFGLSPSDLPTIISGSRLLLLVALFAGYFTARRAPVIDPLVAPVDSDTPAKAQATGELT
jgi:hypothetical protein